MGVLARRRRGSITEKCGSKNSTTGEQLGFIIERNTNEMPREKFPRRKFRARSIVAFKEHFRCRRVLPRAVFFALGISTH